MARGYVVSRVTQALPSWLFAYGSLIWRTDIPFIEKHPAIISGWERRFWQGSTDHRGIPGAPGRVLTLAPIREGRCHGMAFRLPEAELEDIIRVLDHREKNGYERQLMDIHLVNSKRPLNAITYIAHPDNPHFLGEAPIHDMASQVFVARGPSGPNLEYLQELKKELQRHGIEDSHINELGHAVELLSDSLRV